MLVYAFDERPDRRRATARSLLDDAAGTLDGVVSYHILQELINIGFSKFEPRLQVAAAARLVNELQLYVEVVRWSPDLLNKALEIRERYGFSWYDCLMVAAALMARCATLFTEDLQHLQVIDGLTIINPFL